ncbi:hypothetical protein SODALDRAFT_376466 [Sodiomyces alkalinus F11]|uniref:Uncharacterized protein n=1 Tax=Sodiomyces alkalinus (strain CBS 110278 / VKM F-3762 / F11) TaxID=1314773 RepID=A0A3N2Q1S3_SODAK|nr:hypothetical protein SODALDRAFT_376466 [Sodiomyces alkalinus F11]ROT40700.1 hypothetical protein SODALDRAFT_376466 [Sodiomyces alkalinus F11]
MRFPAELTLTIQLALNISPHLLARLTPQPPSPPHASFTRRSDLRQARSKPCVSGIILRVQSPVRRVVSYNP